MIDPPTTTNAPSDSTSQPPAEPRRKAGAIVAGVLAAAVALYIVVRPEPATPLVPVFEHLETHGYVPNRSLGGRYQPGDVIQIADPGPLVTPILALRSEMCFPGLEPTTSPFPLPDDTGSSKASFGLSGAQIAKIFPGLAIDDSVATSSHLVFDRPRVVTVPKLEISGYFSGDCILRLETARAAGDRIEDYATVSEAVIADGMTLEVTWKRGTSAEAQAEIRQQTESALQDVAPTQVAGDTLVTAGTVKEQVAGERRSVWKVEAPMTLGYRTRPMQYQPPEPPAGETIAEPSEQVAASPQAPALVPATAALGAGQPEAPKEAFTHGEGLIGRLVIQLQTDDGWQTVSPERRFQTGERFRFKIESSQEAAVFVYHQPPNGDPAELWPAARQASNAIAPGDSLTVPKPPAAFEMQDETGAETFSVALTSSGTRPSGETLGQYVLRSLGDEGTRGIGIVDPAEHWLYFRPGTKGTLATVDFQLIHTTASK